jgi:DDE superfamily endonuclease
MDLGEKKLKRKIEWHYTPKHASWLNQAELEIHSLSTQCLKGRIPTFQKMQSEVAAWVRDRNEKGVGINWQVDTQRAIRWPDVLNYLASLLYSGCMKRFSKPTRVKVFLAVVLTFVVLFGLGLTNISPTTWTKILIYVLLLSFVISYVLSCFIDFLKTHLTKPNPATSKK